MMLKRDLGGILDLFRRATHYGAKPGGGHRGGAADLGLAASFGPRNRGVVFHQPTNRGGGEQEVFDMRLRRAGHVVEVIAQGCGHHARSAIGGRGNDLPASRVFLVHRHGIDTHPIVDRMWCGLVLPALGHQRVIDTLGAAFHLKTPRQDAIGGQPPVDTIAHHLPEPFAALAQVVSAAARFFVGAFHARDRLARFLRHFKHFCGGLEGERHWRAFIRVLACGQFLLGHDKSATDRIIGLAQGHIALGIGGHQHHAIGVARKLGVVIENHVLRGIKAQFGQTIDGNAVGLLYLFQRLFCSLGVIVLRRETSEAKDRRAVGRVANTCEGKTAMQRRAQPGKLERRGTHLIKEPARGHHRPHGVRRRRADAHFEHIEDGEKHQVADPSGGWG